MIIQMRGKQHLNRDRFFSLWLLTLQSLLSYYRTVDYIRLVGPWISSSSYWTGCHSRLPHGCGWDSHHRVPRLERLLHMAQPQVSYSRRVLWLQRWNRKTKVRAPLCLPFLLLKSGRVEMGVCDGSSWLSTGLHLEWIPIQKRRAHLWENIFPWFEGGESTSSADLRSRKTHAFGLDFEVGR